MSAKIESPSLNTDSGVSLVGASIIDNIPAAIIEPNGKIYKNKRAFCPTFK
jgi:hypothetical protein